MIAERRQAPRVRMYLPVRVHQACAPVLDTLTKDMGVGGLRCLSPTSIPVGREVLTELTLPGSSEVMTLRGRTAWFQVVSEGDQFSVGIAFHDVIEKNKQILSSYISRHILPATL